MKTIKKAAVSTKNFVAKHRVSIAFTAGALSCFALTQHARNDWNEFLKEHELYETYYTPTD